jgi:predicted amidohydrolase
MGFRKHVIERSEVRILAYLHVSFAGIYAFSKTVMVGESEEMRLMAPIEAVQVADANRDVIIGIKVGSDAARAASMALRHWISRCRPRTRSACR